MRADLVAGLVERGAGVDAEHPARPAAGLLERGEAGDHPGVRRAGDRADHDRVEEDAELLLLLGHLVGPVREAEPAEPVVGGAGRDGVRRTAALLDILDGPPPRVAEADVEAGRVEPDLGTHHPAQQDVADLGAERVGPVRHPVLLHQHALQPQVRRDRRHLPGVVGLVATDRDQRVRTLGERLGDEVLELAGLVAAVGEPGVAVLALGPDLGTARGGRSAAAAGGPGWVRRSAGGAGSR